MRITCIIHSLDGGGAEYLMAGLASRFADHHDVTLITLDSPQKDRYEVDHRVARIGLDLMRESRFLLAALWNNGWRVVRLRRAIRDSSPDVVLSFCDKTNILVLVAVCGWHGDALKKHVGSKKPRIPVVISEHSDPRQQLLGSIWGRLRLRFYPQAAGAIALSKTAAGTLGQWVSIPPRVIPPAVAPAVPAPRWEEILKRDAQPEFLWVTVGRLSPEKGFDQAIRAFALLKQIRQDHGFSVYSTGSEQIPRVRLTMAGTGRCRSELEALANDLGVGEEIEFPGWVDDIPALLRRANGFLLPSRYEGFPVGLLQAMAHGVPAVAFDCESGPREIIEHGVNGWLVKNQDIDAMAKTMSWVMEHRDEATRIGFVGTEVAHTFNWQRFVQAHTGLLQELSERSIRESESLENGFQQPPPSGFTARSK